MIEEAEGGVVKLRGEARNSYAHDYVGAVHGDPTFSGYRGSQNAGSDDIEKMKTNRATAKQAFVTLASS